MSDDSPSPFALAVKLVRIAVPITLAQCTVVGAVAVNNAFIGHSVHNSGDDQGYLELSVNIVSLAYFFFFGHVAGLDTIIPQGIGAKNEGRVRRGVSHYVTAMGIQLLLVLVPLCAAVAWLVRSKSPIDITPLQIFLYLYAVNFFLGFRMLIGKLLVFTDGEMKLFYCTIATFTSTVLSQGLVVWLVPESPRRLHFLMLTEATTALTVVLFGIVVVRWFHRSCHPYLPTWSDLRSIWTVNQWRSYFGLSFFSGLISLLDMGSVYGINLLAAFLPDTRYIAVCGNIASICMIFFSVVGGVTTASTSVIGRFVGKRDMASALLAVRVSYAFAFVIALLDAAVMYLLRHPLSRLFSNDPFVISKVEQVLPVFAASHVLDVMQVVAQSVFKAVGQPSIGVRCQLLATYLVGLPLGAALTFGAHMDTFGLWIGQLVGYAVLAVLTIGWSVVRWQSMVDKALVDMDQEDRNEAEQQSLIGSESIESYGATAKPDAPPAVAPPPAGGSIN